MGEVLLCVLQADSLTVYNASGTPHLGPRIPLPGPRTLEFSLGCSVSLLMLEYGFLSAVQVPSVLRFGVPDPSLYGLGVLALAVGIPGPRRGDSGQGFGTRSGARGLERLSSVQVLGSRVRPRGSSVRALGSWYGHHA
ncbi:hypothetical protein NL676_037000 [Syzygium grande]|nr:hypothetical protein NL676_037000 [Syzygium grande]